ncbi:YCF48-related protein [Stratiformator vulcanicus]|uniref:YCF48-related protein n=1 Tax=Stratiformator vulcanicus TaxID=2527980 RepID=UPI00119FD40C|nr:YCF48-related protein [Stratiformator vulcanicus]
MSRLLVRLVFLTAVLLAGSGHLTAAEPTPCSRDDAMLRDITLLGSNYGWAAGDRGTIWKTIDGGQTWELLSTGTDLPLRSICFVTDRVGWAVGGESLPSTLDGEPRSRGCLLATTDGGATWEVSFPDRIPRFQAVRFFDLQTGIAACDPSRRCPSGLVRTVDGGKTWEPLTGTANASWRAAAFASPETAILGGTNGTLRIAVDGSLVEARAESLRLRGIHAITFDADAAVPSGWAVGDGGVILTTTSGIGWQRADASLPPAAEDVFDLWAVAQLGENIWVAGRPGTIVWHSSDGGKSWFPQDTGQSVPIRDIAFSSPEHGIAVGAAGMILKTNDGGAHWQAVRGGGRRAAALSFHASPDDISPVLPAFAGQFGGYRHVSSVPVRRDSGPAEPIARFEDLAAEDVASAADGCAAEIDWRFPISIPGIRRDDRRLIAEWNALTDGHVEPTLLRSLVVTLRTWRPSVVILDQPTERDALTTLLNRAILAAMEQAADPTRQHELVAKAGLQPWRVERVHIRLRGGQGEVRLDPLSLSPEQAGKILPTLARASSIRTSDAAHPLREDFRRFDGTAGAVGTAAGRLFDGLDLPPDSPARRPVPGCERDGLTRSQLMLWKTWQAVSARQLHDPQRRAALHSSILQIVERLPPAVSQRLVGSLFETLLARNEWDAAEKLAEVIVDHPGWPDLRTDAADFLVALRLGAEPRFHRATTAAATARRSTPISSGVKVERTEVDLGLSDRWDKKSILLWKLMDKNEGRWSQRPQAALPLLTLANRGLLERPADLVAGMTGSGANDAWNAAVAESTIGNDTLQSATSVKCRFARAPRLDGLLSDPCWLDANEIRLASPDSRHLKGEPMLFCAHDSEFLYLAGSIPRLPRFQTSNIERVGRKRDEDLSDEDRLVFQIDVDGDALTWFRLEVDHRGHTSDDCWGDHTWDPRWYVASEADDSRWRIEAAVAFADLGGGPKPGRTWNVSIRRIAPTLGVQTWTGDGGEARTPADFGKLRFVRE